MNEPNPTIPRSDGLGVRPATWVSCGYCGVLFLRSLTEIQRREGKPNFCSARHGRFYQDVPKFRDCVMCGREFQVYKDHKQYHKIITCSLCTMGVYGTRPTGSYRAALVLYAYEHGIEANPDLLTCDLCGAGQSYRGKARVKYISVTRLDGRFIARCRRCRERKL